MKLHRFGWTKLLAFAFVWLLPPASAALAQLGPCATPTGPDLPDLIVDQGLLKAQLYLTEETFGPSSCTVGEGCVTSPGTHLLLRFMSSTPNIGKADLFIGDPAQCPGLFQFSQCHQHLHFREYSDYRLWTAEGYENWVANRDLSQPTNSGGNAAILASATAAGELVVGRKQGFCVIDVAPYRFSDIEPGPPLYRSCLRNQGIKVGWADQYRPQLACQFVQMTNVSEGTYVLEVQVDPEQLFPESDYTNNAAAAKFYFKPKQGRFGPAITILN